MLMRCPVVTLYFGSHIYFYIQIKNGESLLLRLVPVERLPRGKSKPVLIFAAHVDES